MKSLLIAFVLCAATSVFAKDYQVTGEVIEVSPTKITVDKKGEKFEIDMSATTKNAGTVKKGTKVTVYYTMAASEVEVKEAKEAKTEKKKK